MSGLSISLLLSIPWMAIAALGVVTADPCSKVAWIDGDEVQSLAVHTLATNFLPVVV